MHLNTDLANIEVIRIFTLSWTDLYRYWLEILNNYKVKEISCKNFCITFRKIFRIFLQ